jgi:hypothetical protein
MLDKATLLDRINLIKSKRQFLEDLAQQPNLGILELDVSQALSELNDLIEEFEQTFSNV